MITLSKEQVILNKIELNYTQHDLSDTFLKIAAGGLSFGDLLNWILDHQV